MISLMLPGCALDDLAKKKGDSKTQDDANRRPDEEDTTADEPVEVTGSWLAELNCVSLEQSQTYHVETGSAVFGCDVLKSSDKTRIKIKTAESTLKVVLKSGEILNPVSAPASIAEAPFQIYFSVVKSVTDSINIIALKTVSEAGDPLELEQSFILRHISDPEYLAAAYAQGVLYDILGSKQNDIPPAGQALPPAPAEAAHLLFTSQKVYPGNTGIGGADAICDAAGKKVDPARSWIALLSTSTKNAKDRLEIKGPVYNVMAERIADNAVQLWSGTLQNKPQFTEFGQDLSEYIVKLLKYKNARTWTGSRTDGTYNAEKGTCLDWSVDAFEIGAGIGSAESLIGKWIDKEDDVPCNHLGRFYCISK